MFTDPNFSIAIVGGGIGGLFAALCIHHHYSSSSISRPIQIDVYEQAAEYKEIGAGIGVGINAVRLVEKLGLVDDLYAISGNPNATNLGPGFRRFDNGGEIFRWPVKPGRIRLASCSRSALLDLLRAAIEQRGAAKLHTGKSCHKVEVSRCHLAVKTSYS